VLQVIQRLLGGLGAKAFQLQTDVAMQSFVGPVALGMAGPATFQIDAQGYPPGG